MKTSKFSAKKILQTVFSHLLLVAQKDEIYLVGGAVRDLLRNVIAKNNARPHLEITDYDFALKSTSPLRLARNLSSKIPDSNFFILDDERHTYRLIAKPRGSAREYTFDFSTYRGSSIKKDLLKRDITINALAIDIKDISPYSTKSPHWPNTKEIVSKIIDPSGGINDIKKNSIHFISIKNLREDPVRILRAFRFSAELNFSMPYKTLSSAKRLRREITRAPMERIRDEMLKILDTPRATQTLKLLDKTSLLEIIIPEITALKKSCRKFYFHPKGLWHHIAETLARMEEYTSDIVGNFPDSSAELAAYFWEKISFGTRLALLKLATLLHDSAKPFCLTRAGGRIRFFGHETMGAKIFQNVARRLKLSRDEINFGAVLVKNHMRILQLAGSKTATDRAIYRLKTEAGEHFPALCLLSLSDAASYKNLHAFTKNNNIKDVQDFVRRELKIFFEEKKSKPLPKIIDGNIIMRRFNIQPGPIVGEILRRLNEERALGKIKNTAEALEAARKFLKRISKNHKTK